MTITNISASVKMSKQLPAGEWATIELGAQEELTPEYFNDGITWQDLQKDLYSDLKRQLATLWDIKARDNGTTNGQGQGNRKPGEHLDTTTGELIACPTHHTARDSGKPPGRFYCPTTLDDGTYCPWTYKR